MVVRPQDTQQLHPPTNQPKVQPDCCQSEYQTSADFPSWSQQTKTQPSHPPAPASERETHSWSPTTPVTSPPHQPPPPSHSTAHEPHPPPTPPTPSPYQKSHGYQYQTASPHTHQPCTSPYPPAPTTAHPQNTQYSSRPDPPEQQTKNSPEHQTKPPPPNSPQQTKNSPAHQHETQTSETHSLPTTTPGGGGGEGRGEEKKKNSPPTTPHPNRTHTACPRQDRGGGTNAAKERSKHRKGTEKPEHNSPIGYTTQQGRKANTTADTRTQRTPTGRPDFPALLPRSIPEAS